MRLKRKWEVFTVFNKIQQHISQKTNDNKNGNKSEQEKYEN